MLVLQSELKDLLHMLLLYRLSVLQELKFSSVLASVHLPVVHLILRHFFDPVLISVLWINLTIPAVVVPDNRLVYVKFLGSLLWCGMHRQVDTVFVSDHAVNSQLLPIEHLLKTRRAMFAVTETFLKGKDEWHCFFRHN